LTSGAPLAGCTIETTPPGTAIAPTKLTAPDRGANCCGFGPKVTVTTAVPRPLVGPIEMNGEIVDAVQETSSHPGGATLTLMPADPPDAGMVMFVGDTMNPHRADCEMVTT
jgi:hypothetical protein